MIWSSPRIIFKDDRDSSIGRGADMRPGHFGPGGVAELLWAMGVTSPPELTHIVVTEGRRKIREALDYHEILLALDFRILYPELAGWDASRIEEMVQDWCRRALDLLGPGWQLVIHGDGWNRHIHAERDLR